jgi:hypothetical protein
MSSKLRYDDILSRPIGIGKDLDVSILEWIIQQIDTANGGIISVKIADLKKTPGPDCEKRSDTVLFFGLRSALKKYGINVRIKTYKDEGKMLMMSNIKHEHDRK